jgi:hypothetical protein
MGAFISWVPKAGGPRSLFFDVVTEESVNSPASVTDHPVEDGPNVADHIRLEPKKCTLQVFISNSPVYDVNGRGGRVSSLPMVVAVSSNSRGRTETVPVKTYDAPLPLNPAGAVTSAVSAAVKSFAGTGNKELKVVLYDRGVTSLQSAAQVMQFPSEFDAVADTVRTLEELQNSYQLVSIYLPYKTYENMYLEGLQVTRNTKTGDGAQLHLDFKQLFLVEAKLVNAPIPTQSIGTPMKAKGAQGTKVAPALAADKVKSVAKGLIGGRLKGR